MILKVLFIIDEEHLELAIEQDIDLLPIFLIYAPKWVQAAQSLARRQGFGYEQKVTLESAVKFLHDECVRKRVRYYDIIVNLPEGSDPPPDVYPPPGADITRVMWFYNNVRRLLRFLFHGEVPESSRKAGIIHLKWLAEQKQKGKTQLGELLEQVKRDRAQAGDAASTSA